MSDELLYLIDVVKKASTLITSDFEVKAKGNNGDLVTNFDLEIENFIINKLKEKYPTFDIVSEEYNSDKGLKENCFVIDPIDGTINFANNIQIWAIQIAMIKNSETVAAVIYSPKLEELYCADSSGAYLNSKKIRVNKLDTYNGLYVIDGTNQFGMRKRIVKENPHLRCYYAASLEYAWVACGRLSGMAFLKDTLWDYIPGEYIVKQAGGVIHNEAKLHLAANNEKFLELMKKNK